MVIQTRSYIINGAEFGHFHILYADLMVEKNMPNKAIDHLNKRIQLSPRNIPLTIKYAELQLSYGDPVKAHEILLDLFNNNINRFSVLVTGFIFFTSKLLWDNTQKTFWINSTYWA